MDGGAARFSRLTTDTIDWLEVLKLPLFFDAATDYGPFRILIL
jgi:hypothetical protein